MASGHLSIDEVLHFHATCVNALLIVQFLTRLTSLFESCRVAAHGSVFLTQKRRTLLTSSSIWCYI